MNKYSGLEALLEPDQIKYNDPMKNHTTMKVGGPCDCMVLPVTIEQIQSVIAFAKENDIPYYVMGNGSNLLVRDEGVHRLIIKIKGGFNHIDVNENELLACAGATMPKLAVVAKENSLAGLEFACGIPGTIGGGVRMNAGAYGGELADVLVDVTYLNEEGDVCVIKKEDMNCSYRHTIFTDHPAWIILQARFALQPGNLEEITEKMEANKAARISKQPLEYPSAGSVFTRPKGYFVGKLVQDSGLRGVSVGGAQVSEKHTGFIINKGGATCADVLNLIQLVQDTVYEKFQVRLKTEVIVIGGEE